jgi:hypothetical protein
MNAQVLTSKTSASDGSEVYAAPWATSVATIRSESTVFLSQPSVMMQNFTA